MDLKGKTILLTGATGGIGRLVAQRLDTAGACVVLSCYLSDKLADLKAELGGNHVTVCADISSEQGRDAIVSACSEAGGIDGIVNLAGILDFALFSRQEVGLLEKMIAINLTAPMLLTRLLLDELTSREEAVILNVGSIFGSIGHPGFTAYCATKAGLMRFTESLSRELADTPVRVAYIAPRATKTSLNDDRVNALNTELGNKSDAPELVADQIMAMLRDNSVLQYLGWPEKLFVRINALLPSLVGSALTKNLGQIKHYARR